MFVHVRVPTAQRRAEHLAAFRDVRPMLTLLVASTAAVAACAYAIDPTPHMPPDHSVSLLVAAWAAAAIQAWAISVRYRQHITTLRRRNALRERLADDAARHA